MAHHDFGSLGRIVPNTAVFNTPFVYRDAAHSMNATDPAKSPALREINAELVQKGSMRIIGSLFQGTRQLTSKEKVLTPKDMAGKKYRGVLVAGKRDVNIDAVEAVGNYAVLLRFSDGHASGLYSWDLLHALGRDHARNWQDYLDALAANGLSRAV